MRTRLKLITLATTLIVMAATQAQTRSNNFRIEGDSFVTIAASTSSSNFSMTLVGGSGSPVGTGSSPSYTIKSGPGLTSLPTERIFNSSFE